MTGISTPPHQPLRERLCRHGFRARRGRAVRDRKPCFLVEAHHSGTALSAALGHFQAQTQAAHAFQVVTDLPFEPVDCFAWSRPCVVPACTLLSQLL